MRLLVRLFGGNDGDFNEAVENSANAIVATNMVVQILRLKHFVKLR